MRAGVHLVGIAWCARDGLAQRVRTIGRWVGRHGALHTAGQVLGRFYDRARNGRLDHQVLTRLIDDSANQRTLEKARIPSIRTDSYSRPATRAEIAEFDPDIFVVHTKFIVGPTVRRLARVATVGGHPGITPWYRGTYSPFWAVSRDEPAMVGCTVFLLDDGIDTGPVLFQERITICPGEDSHLTLAWKGMQRQSALQAEAIRRLDAGECLPLRRHPQVPEGSYFTLPTLCDFLRYHRRQRLVR